MATKDTNIKYKKCKFDFERGLVVEYLKDEILEHPISEVFAEYSVNQNDHFFDLTLKETQEIIPSNISLSDE